MSERTRDHRSRSPLRDVEPGWTTEANHWSPEDEMADVIPQHSPENTGGYAQYDNGSIYEIRRENVPAQGRDVYRLAHDHSETRTSRTGYGNHHQGVDWNGQARGGSYTNTEDANSTRRFQTFESMKNTTHREHPNTELPRPMITEGVQAKQTHRSIGKERSNQILPQSSQKLGLPHLLESKDVQMPPTAYDLRVFTRRIDDQYAGLPRERRFKNGNNGKASPSIYGSETRHDLGLCFATFLTRETCEMGLDCPWRHHPLSVTEKIWVVEYGKERGKEFLMNAERCYSCPQMPVPGANMHLVGE